MKKFTTIAITLAVFMLCHPLTGWGQLFVDEFNYTAGTTLVSNGWAITGTTATPTLDVSATSISYSGYLSSGIGNEVTFATSGQDVNHSFPSQTSGTVYASCLINITSASTGGDYFFHLGASTIGTTYHGRVYVKRDASNNLAFGISKTGNATVAVFTPFSYSMSTTYLLVLRYSIVSGTSNDVAAIFINPALNSAEPGSGWITSTDVASDLTNLGAVALRQGATATAPALKLDGVRVATQWSDIVGAGASTPTKLAISSVNGGTSPLVNTPFSITVQSQDASGSPANVTANTAFSLSLSTGTGSLGGTLTGTINAGGNSVIVTGVTYDIAESGVSVTATRTSGDVLSPGTSSPFIVLPVITAYRSYVSGNWNSIGTWEAYTGSSWIAAYDFPTSSTKDVTIQSGHSVIVPVSFNTGSAYNLTVENGATLYANSTTSSCFVYVYGNITNNGTIGGPSDVIGFDIEGSSCQLSGSGTFNVARVAKFTTTNLVTNFSINQDISLSYTSATTAALRNSAGVTTTFNMVLEAGKKLSVPNAKIDLTSCTLTIKDGASLIDNGTITGATTNVSVERFITKYNVVSDEMFHFLSSPVSGQAIQPGFVSLPNTTDDFYSWDETVNLWINSKDNAGNWNSAFESNFTVGKGYLVAYPADVTKTFTGPLNTGTLVSGTGLPALTFTTGQGDGWNLMGNPYPSAIDWDNVTSGQYSNLDNAVYVYENASATYKTYVSGAGTLTDGVIPSTQAFFVHASSASPSLTLENLDRVHSSAVFYKNDPLQNIVRLKVEGNNRYDEAIIRFMDEATTSFDGQLDAYKLSGGPSVPQFYSVSGTTHYSVNSLPMSELNGFVPLSIEAGKDAEYSISLVSNTLPENYYVTLEDLKTGTIQRLNNNPAYSFTASPSDDASRFKLIFKDATSVADPASATNFVAYASEGTIYVKSEKAGKVTLSDLSGRMISNGQLNPNTESFKVQVSPGIYLVSLINENGLNTQKVLVK